MMRKIASAMVLIVAAAVVGKDLRLFTINVECGAANLYIAPGGKSPIIDTGLVAGFGAQHRRNNATMHDVPCSGRRFSLILREELPVPFSPIWFLDCPTAPATSWESPKFDTGVVYKSRIPAP